MDSVLTEMKNGVFWIRMNRPKKLNATNAALFHGLIEAFDRAEKDEQVILTVLTGNGRCFCVGADLSPSEMDANLVDPEGDVFSPYKLVIDRMIRHSKPIIALVNGDAVGFGATCLALCDAVFAKESARLWTPFSEIAVSPEGCSIHLFPKIMGYQKAAQMILFAEKITATQARDAGLVTKIFQDADFEVETEKIVQRYSKLSGKSLLISKRLLRPQNEIDQLLTVNIKEHELLMRQFQSEEFMVRAMDKMSGSKL